MPIKFWLRGFLFGLTAMVVLLLPTSSARAAEAVDWQNSSITVTGMGIAPPRAINASHGRMMARRAAMNDCYRQLAEAIEGVNVDAESTVENFILTSDVTKTSVHALIRGASIVDEREIPGGYEVTMSVAMFGASNSLANVVLPKTTARESFPEPVPSVAPSVPAYDSSASVNVRIDIAHNNPGIASDNRNPIGGYTGLIVDCRGLDLKPMMSPVIKNQNGESIYGHKNLNPDFVISHGMVSYTRDLNGGNGRAGSNPLVVRAVGLTNHNGYPVLSVADANRVLIENQATGFLEKTNVVFVR